MSGVCVCVVFKVLLLKGPQHERYLTSVLPFLCYYHGISCAFFLVTVLFSVSSVKSK